jgi:hypothetical protein
MPSPLNSTSRLSPDCCSFSVPFRLNVVHYSWVVVHFWMSKPSCKFTHFGTFWKLIFGNGQCQNSQPRNMVQRGFEVAFSWTWQQNSSKCFWFLVIGWARRRSWAKGQPSSSYKHLVLIDLLISTKTLSRCVFISNQALQHFLNVTHQIRSLPEFKKGPCQGF